jgi:predicted phosphodiesterase
MEKPVRKLRIEDVIDDADPKLRVKALEDLVKQQAQVIEGLRKPRITVPVGGKKKRGPGNKAFLRVVYGDTHGAYQDPHAVRAFVDDLKLLQPRELVHVGDALEATSFLAPHHVLGVVAQCDYTYSDDFRAANDLFDKIHNAAPTASHTLIEGNHDARIEKQCVKWALEKKQDVAFFKDQLGPEAVLNLKTRGIRYIERHKHYDGLGITGTIKLEPFALAQHGEAYCGENAVRQHLAALGKSIFFGHTHKLIAHYSESLNGSIVAVNTGCLCVKRPLWQLTKCTNWTHGYVVELVDPDHGFLALPVPIVDGVSYLEPLMKALNLK